ncbi:putative carbohydrate-binding protein, partial [Paenibacillus agaridevorans]
MKFKLAVVLIVLQYFIFSSGIVPTPLAHAETVDSVFYETSEVFYETSFEDAEDLAFITDFTERDASDMHTGSYSLKYTNDGNKPVSFIRIPVKAGYAYDVSVWMKTAELTGQWAGGRVAIDAYDQAGNWSFGKYMNPVNSEEEWQLVRLPTYVAGENVVSAQFSLYSEGTGGTIWFDDLRITEKLFVEEDTNGNYETSFEDITDTTWDKSFTDYDTSEVNNGEYALKYTFNGSNPTVSVRIPVKAGYAYDATVWVKTADLTGMWAGARIAVDGYDENGGWKLGKYMDPMSSNGIWIQLRLPTYIADKGTVYADFALYSYGESGTIWFDDLKIVEYKPDPLIAKLVTPQYRGILMPDGNPIVTVATRGTVGLTAEDYTTTVKLVNADEETIEEQVWTEKLDTLAEFDTTALAAGDYEAVVTTYVTNKPAEAFVERFKIKKVSTVSELPKSYVDDYGRFWRDGELFFPIGIYTANIDESELQDLSDSPFNTIMPYDYPNLDQLNLAEQYGQKVIFSLKDFFYDFPYAPPFIEDEDDEVEAITLMAEQYRNHPALLAWYLSDETPTDKRLSTHYKTIVENDPN